MLAPQPETLQYVLAAATAAAPQKVLLRHCTRCETVSYCSREHQLADWPRHRHECRARP
jgi:hypothetical protein